MQITAPAKLNLCLDITQKSPNGYHEIRTVFFEYKKLADLIEIKESKEEDNLSTLHGPTISDYPKLSKEENLIMKAVDLVKKNFGIHKNLEIKVEKNIPYSSGLGGGASGAASVLKALNELWGLGLASEELEALGASLGMDVPFFIRGGLAMGTNFGEKITPLKTNLPLDSFIELFPRQAPPEVLNAKTKNAYSLLDLSSCGKNTHLTDQFIEALTKNNELANHEAGAIAALLHNDFETLFPVAPPHHLSGAGPSTFIFKTD